MLKRLSHLASRLARGRPPVGSTPHDVVHTENKWRLFRYRGTPRYATPVVLIPSLINRHYVLDLLPGKSFAEWMVARGHDLYIVDWGTPGDEDRYVTFDDICDRAIGRALRVAARTSNAESAHLLGYCLGGTLTAIHTAARPEHVASLTTLAAPIRFADDGLLSRWTRVPEFDVNALVDGFGNVPWQLMQSAFHLLRPTLGLSKAVGMIDRAWDDEFLDGFLALETWGNDNVSFPGEFYRRYIEELYRGDRLIEGTFALSGIPARLESITCPTTVVTFEHDTIVPWQSAKVLHDRVGATDKEWIHLKGGHVGAVVSKSAASRLWPKLSELWAAREPSKRARRTMRA
jgi:polyhydroxyalkanoate synthase